MWVYLQKYPHPFQHHFIDKWRILWHQGANYKCLLEQFSTFQISCLTSSPYSIFWLEGIHFSACRKTLTWLYCFKVVNVCIQHLWLPDFVACFAGAGGCIFGVRLVTEIWWDQGNLWYKAASVSSFCHRLVFISGVLVLLFVSFLCTVCPHLLLF